MAIVVDGHVHVFARKSEPYPRAADALAPAAREASDEELLAAMDAAGVERAVLVPLGSEDRYVLECVDRHPTRFSAVSVLDAAAPDPMPRFRSQTAHPAVRGVRMFGLGGPAPGDPGERPMFPVLREMERRGLVLWWYGPTEDLPALTRALEALPGLRVAMNHMGFSPQGMTVDEFGRPRIAATIPPPTLPTVLALSRFPGVHVMLSGAYAFSRQGYPYRDMAPVARALMDAFGARRMFWASDHPWIAHEPGYREMAALPRHLLGEIGPAAEAEVMGGTALRLLAGLASA